MILQLGLTLLRIGRVIGQALTGGRYIDQNSDFYVDESSNNYFDGGV